MSIVSYGANLNEDVKFLEDVIVKDLFPCVTQYKKDKAALLDAGVSETTAEVIAKIDFRNCLDKT